MSPPVAEYKFHPVRKWRFDFCWIKEQVAVEIDGGVYTGGRHTRGAGFEKDCEKRNTATSMRYSVFNFTPQMLDRDPKACIEMVSEYLKR